MRQFVNRSMTPNKPNTVCPCLTEALQLRPGQPGGEVLRELRQEPVWGELVTLHPRGAARYAE